MKISGWGRFPIIDAEATCFETRRQLRTYLERKGDCIAYAQGRSYGDSALNERVVLSRRYDKILAFDPLEGIVGCESGVTLAEIIEAFLPRGWFLPITPGTKFISVGGAVASDVHGKNHHKTGCFSECVLSFNLMLPGGQVAYCSREENADLFHATCGGMGLTGIILTVNMKLLRVKSAYIRETIIQCANLEEVFHQFEAHFDSTYSVAWIDCLAKGDRGGRSVLMLGEHAHSGKLEPPAKTKLSVPFNSPAFLLNRYSTALFNSIYYKSRPSFTSGRLVPLEGFFYPLDGVDHWNRIYGSKGFTQYQFVLPKEASPEGLKAVLHKTSEAGVGSFLAVLKLLGPRNDNYLSFPMEGYTLALDFKIQKKLFPLLTELDHIVLDYGGRIYLSKDARMSEDTFRRGYPQWDRFSRLREQYGMGLKFNSHQSRRLGV